MVPNEILQHDVPAELELKPSGNAGLSALPPTTRPVVGPEP
jgi:hypothetical protein